MLYMGKEDIYPSPSLDVSVASLLFQIISRGADWHAHNMQAAAHSTAIQSTQAQQSRTGWDQPKTYL